MIGWIVFGVWLCSALWGARFWANHAYRSAVEENSCYTYSDPTELDGEDWFIVVLAGIGGFVTGPLILVGLVLRTPLMRLFVPERAAQLRRAREASQRQQKAAALDEAAVVFADDPVTATLLREAAKELRSA